MQKEIVYLTCTEFAKMFNADTNLVYYWISQGWLKVGRLGGRYVIDEEYAKELLRLGQTHFPNFRATLYPRLIYRMQHQEEVS
jgi:hypothetical protein